jgi:TPR repeat protein
MAAAAALLAPPLCAEEPVPTACDLLAAHPSDPDKIVEGVSSTEARKDIGTAIAACRRAVEDQPDVPRLTYYLGRVLFYDGQFEEGFPLVVEAAGQGHRQAQFVAAYVLMDGVPETIEADPCRSLALWRDAAGRGHYAASLALARHTLGGDFAGCENLPSVAEMRSNVDQAAGHDMADDYYHGLLIGLLQEALADEAP